MLDLTMSFAGFLLLPVLICSRNGMDGKGISRGPEDPPEDEPPDKLPLQIIEPGTREEEVPVIHPDDLEKILKRDDGKKEGKLLN